jgi:hypothetical protein
MEQRAPEPPSNMAVAGAFLILALKNIVKGGNLCLNAGKAENG